MPMNNARNKSLFAIYSDSAVDNITDDYKDEKKSCLTLYKTPKHYNSFLTALEDDYTIAKTDSRKVTQIIIYKYGLLRLNEKGNPETTKFREMRLCQSLY